jgi:hypothetical protein
MGCVSKEIGRETSPSRDLSSSPDPKKITVEEPIHQDPATIYPIFMYALKGLVRNMKKIPALIY